MEWLIFLPQYAFLNNQADLVVRAKECFNYENVLVQDYDGINHPDYGISEVYRDDINRILVSIQMRIPGVN